MTRATTPPGPATGVTPAALPDADAVLGASARPPRCILVPIDSSGASARALPVAAAIARLSGARVHVVTVFLLFPPGAHEPDLGGFHGPSEEDLIDAERDGVRRTAERLATEYGVEAVGELLTGQGGDTVRGENACVAERLLEYIERHDVDLVVATTHGRGGVSRAWLGSVADALVQRAGVPLLFVRPAGGQPPGSARLFSRILVPLDGSPLADRALGDAAALARLSGAGVTLLHVVTPPSGVARMNPVTRAGADDLAGRQDEARTHLADAAGALRAVGLTAQTLLYALERPAEAILDVARQRGVDLIAMSSHGRGGMRRLVLGSVADQVLREAPCSVLVRPPAAQPADAR